MKVIINGDDLGYSERMNRVCFNLMEMGKISSATILANGPYFEECVKKSRVYTDCSFGVHLNLTEFMPLTNSQIMYETHLVDENGFTTDIRNIKLSKELKEAIYLELSEQIVKILDNGISISHIDSHNHIHTIPSLFFVIKRLQKKFGIRRIRNSMNYYNKFYNISSGKKIVKNIWAKMMKFYDNSLMTDCFTFAEYFIEDSFNDNFGDNFTIELMTHPGSESYNRETSLLFGNWLDNDGIKLISYWDLRN